MRLLVKALGRAIATHCESLLEKADPRVLAVQKGVLRTCRRVDNIFLDSRIYRNRYLAKDVATYRAAAVSVALAPHVEYDRAIEDGRGWGSRCALQNWVLDALENWQAVLSPTRRAYRSLSRTLMQLPSNIPIDLLKALSAVELECPIFDRVVLIAVLQSRDHLYSVCAEEHLSLRNATAMAREANVRLFMHASRSDIYRVMQIIGNELQCELSPRRLEDIGSAVRYLMDYPDAHHGRLQGLARKSIEWHRDGAIYELDRDASSHLDQSTARPPIEMPADPNVTFLASIREIYREGKEMHSCVAGLADAASAGRVYLFHCEHNGHRATIQVGPTGQFVEASGPCNQQNQASAYGRKVLLTWGERLASRDHRERVL
ncbi:PcfJ domain-containing protein [Adhaeretor mobilis]|nr:PcfJ domain-containing protein [Adhaeretor mobilis]